MESDPVLTTADLLSSLRAVRFALVALIVGVSYPNIRCALAIFPFQQIYHDMLGNKPFPPETAFVIHWREVLVGLSFAIPTVAIAALFIRRLSTSINLASGLVILVMFQLFWTWHAISQPLFTIIQGMQAAGPGQ
jgi:hypothetical protein